MKYILFAFLCLAVINVSAADRVRIVGPASQDDPQKSFYIKMLALALQKSEKQFGSFSIKYIDPPMYQERQLKSLQSGLLDVVWTMTTEAREATYRAVKVPLTRGLIGYRVALILKKNQIIFDKVSSARDYKRLLALQGHDWPDVGILRANGFEIVTSANYQHFFELLYKPGVRQIPRGVLEGTQELARLQNPEYQLEKKHLMVYPTAIYYFVEKGNKQLQTRLHYGLQQAQKDGSFDDLLLNYPPHQPALTSLNIKQRTVHCFKNPLLPKDFPLHERQLWMAAVQKDFEVCNFKRSTSSA